MTTSSTREQISRPGEPGPCNEVVLVGRVSATPQRRELPSGDQLVTLRVVVDRPPASRTRKSLTQQATTGTDRRAVDVIDVACWTRRVQRTAARLEARDVIRVEGALRRRFFATAGSRASRYEVEATRMVRLSRPPG